MTNLAPVKVGMVSLGCPKNLVDSEVMLGTLASHRYQVTNDASQAEVLIVNTCGFIDKAKKESVDTILEMARHKKDGACKRLIVTGCLVQGYVDELKKELPEVDAFLGSADYPRIAQVVGELLDERRLDQGPLTEVHSPVYLYDEHSPRFLTTPSYTAYLKMAEGCDHVCAFCSIPKLRGKLRSRSVESCVAEATTLAARGIKELNLISQDSSEYGRDLYGEPRLRQLIEAIDKVEGLRWVRVHYLYPAFQDDALMEAWAGLKRVVPYIDLPLQHGSTSMLKAMRRPGSREGNLKLLAKFREKIPDAALRSSFIVGYPGETDEQFQELLGFLREAQLDRVGVFTYSQEELTPSGSLPDQLPEKIKLARQREAMRVAAEVSAKRLALRVGQEIEVLVESQTSGAGLGASVEHGPSSLSPRDPAARDKGWMQGRSKWDAPDIDGKVFFKPLGSLVPGDMVRVKVTQSDTHDLHGVQLA